MDEGAESCNANKVLMLRSKLKTLEEHTVIANKSVLESEKERDKRHKELELIEVQLQGKRTRTHDDTGDGHDMHLHDQPKSRTGKDGFLLHVRLGLFRWMTYWDLKRTKPGAWG